MLLAVTVSSSIVPSYTLTVLFASAVPISATVPLSVEKDAITGFAGATVSTVTENGEDGELVVPPLVAVAVKLWPPFTNAAVV
jgi:hypothetical protein